MLSSLVLLERKADTEITSNDGWTALIGAVKAKSVNMTQMLLEKQADVSTSWGEDGETALIAAAKSGSEELVSLLVMQKAQVETKDKNGLTALMAAAHADHEVQDPQGKTPLDIALQGKHLAVVKLLEERRKQRRPFYRRLRTDEKSRQVRSLKEAAVNEQSSKTREIRKQERRQQTETTLDKPDPVGLLAKTKEALAEHFRESESSRQLSDNFGNGELWRLI